MAIKLPVLDDKTYAELVEEARTALPAIHPGWTDHNPSDPGIALIELFAWLTEMLIFRAGRIPESSERAFLRLLSGGAHGGEADLGAATEATLRDLRELYRAVTADDYERLVASAWPRSPEALELEAKDAGSSEIARAHCVPERDLSAANKLAAAPSHVSLIVVPRPKTPWMAPSAALLGALTAFFAERRLITTRLHVVGPTPVPITLEATIHLRDDAPPGGAGVRGAIQRALLEHFDPYPDGRTRRGWPFGRDVDLSDVLAVIDDVEGVEYVATDATLKLTAPGDVLGSRQNTSGGKLLGLRIEAHELPRFEPANMKLTLMERRGSTWWPIP
ncbi:hypothetical protein WME90_32440 [Sorangium sp. So ce375]|uniref:baseplate protein J n=1 Tax=Sorangium sp. So ce375 TaxID=3133306 RepID=UPI003F5C212B